MTTNDQPDTAALLAELRAEIVQCPKCSGNVDMDGHECDCAYTATPGKTPLFPALRRDGDGKVPADVDVGELMEMALKAGILITVGAALNGQFYADAVFANDNGSNTLIQDEDLDAYQMTPLDVAVTFLHAAVMARKEAK